jgi:hypothetical protein
VDTNSTEAIRAFIRAHIAIDPHKLKDDIYKARWINDYNNKKKILRQLTFQSPSGRDCIYSLAHIQKSP